MSLAIDIDEITSVKIGEKWYPVIEKSFDTDAYEFVWKGRDFYHYNGSEQGCSTGCKFITEIVGGTEVWMFAPMTSVLAVAINRKIQEVDG